MGLRGPKKLTSAELRLRGSRLTLVRAREKEEQVARRQSLLGRPTEGLPVPEGLTHPPRSRSGRRPSGTMR